MHPSRAMIIILHRSRELLTRKLQLARQTGWEWRRPHPTGRTDECRKVVLLPGSTRPPGTLGREVFGRWQPGVTDNIVSPSH